MVLSLGNLKKVLLILMEQKQIFGNLIVLYFQFPNQKRKNKLKKKQKEKQHEKDQDQQE